MKQFGAPIYFKVTADGIMTILRQCGRYKIYDFSVCIPTQHGFWYTTTWTQAPLNHLGKAFQ